MNHSKSMLSEGTNGELHRVQADVVLSAAGEIVLIEDVESEFVDNVVEEVEEEMGVLLEELVVVVVVEEVGGDVVVEEVGGDVVVVVLKVVKEDGAMLVVVLCVRLV